MKKLIFFLILIIIVIIIILAIDFYNKVFTGYKGYQSDKITINIEKGSSVSTIAGLLYQKKIISSYSYFILYYRFCYSDLPLKSGEYEFDSLMTMREIIEKLNKGKVILYKITIKEGMTIRETANFLNTEHNINSQKFLQKCLDISLISELDDKAVDLEGYLFPDTYLVPKGISVSELVEIMVNRFKKNFNNSMVWRAKDINMSVRETVILASLIEKETSSREERFLISSVFHNRLKIGMALACDPTIIYALERENKYIGRLRWKDLKFDSPYNTRIYKGLPPGPICSPGFASLEAALFPQDSKYLYFVAKDNKSHYFSKTLKEHNWAVRKYIINRRK